MCGWLWRCRCMCGEMSLYPVLAPALWWLLRCYLPNHPGPWLLWPCLFLLQPCPCLCCKHILWSCHVVGVAALPLWEQGGASGEEEEEGLSFSIRHPPAAPRVMAQVCLWAQPLVLLPTCFSQNGLGWPNQGMCLLVGLSLKEGSCGRGSGSCGGCWGWQLAGTSVWASPAGWLHRLSAKWGLLHSPC